MKALLFAVAFFIGQCPAFAQDKKSLTVNFDFDKDELTRETITKLDSFINNINKSGIISIQLTGHCDSKGTDAYNDALSLKRVNKVKDFLEKNKSISAAGLTADALGEKNLLNSEATEEEQHQNRRVEIVVTIKIAQPVVEEKKETKSLTTILEDTAIKVGTTVTLQNLNFENNSDVLIPSSVPTLEELLQVMIKNPKMRIVIEGHICCVPKVEGRPFSEWPNFPISLLRAKMVYDYLLRNGIDVGRMSYTAFGSSKPVYAIPEKTEAQRIANRRVEIRIMEK